MLGDVWGEGKVGLDYDRFECLYLGSDFILFIRGIFGRIFVGRISVCYKVIVVLGWRLRS